MTSAADPRIVTAIHDVLDPLTNERHDVVVGSGRWWRDGVPTSAARVRDVDGAHLWVLPGLYDADAHMPLLLTGPRAYDLFAAQWGGVTQMNVALPWQLLGATPIADVVAEAAKLTLPRITLLLSVMPNDESAGFAAWIGRNVGQVTDLLPPVCKLYTVDPNFDRNLDAVWGAGLVPMVFCETADDLERLLPHAHGPLHFRHATSAAVAAAMRSVDGATVQTSPHFLLPIPDDRRTALTVLPAPPGAADRSSLAAVFLEQIDVLASDHVSPAPAPPGGPGLQTQQHLMHALLAAASANGWPLGDVLRKATTAPAAVFGIARPPGFVVWDPATDDSTSTFPKQRPDRAPYLGLDLPGRVVAIGCGDAAAML